jgi:hypothetical protein
MTNKTQRVPVMPVPDLVRDDGSPMNAGSLTGIQSRMMWVCSFKSLNLGLGNSRKPEGLEHGL